MRNKLLTMATALLLLLTLSIPAHGAEDWMAQEPQLNHVTDGVGLLDDSEIAALEEQAETISRQYNFGVYIIVVDDYREFTDGNIFDTTLAIYQNYSLGLGADKNGVVLLLSMAERDFYLLTHGDMGQTTFNQAGREYLTAYFLDDFRVDDWYAGFADYLFWCGEYLAAAELGEPYSANNIPMSAEEKSSRRMMGIGAIVLIPLVIAGIYVLILTRKMKSVAQATQASVYLSGSLQLSDSWDRFTHSTQRRRKIEKPASTTSHSSGNASGTGGKF